MRVVEAYVVPAIILKGKESTCLRKSGRGFQKKLSDIEGSKEYTQ